MTIGVVFASTGGNKLERCIRSFHTLEPDLNLHVIYDVSSYTWQMRNRLAHERLDQLPYLVSKKVTNRAHINGILNSALAWMQDLGHEYAALFHDDLVFSPLWRHRHSLSRWFDDPHLPQSSGLSFAHFETFVGDAEGRRPSEAWDHEDLESPELWRHLAGFTRRDGAECIPPNRTFWFKYEGADVLRKWNRLGPSGQIVPIATWQSLGGFDEVDGIFYDQEYPSECFRRKLPPIYALPSMPYIHLHNQSMNPWGDPAPAGFADTGAAYAKRFGARDNRQVGADSNVSGWAGFWGDRWEEEWKA